MLRLCCLLVDGTTQSGNSSTKNSARWHKRDRTLRAGVEAGHLPAAVLEAKTAEGIGVQARRWDLPGLHCQRGSRYLCGRTQAIQVGNGSIHGSPVALNNSAGTLAEVLLPDGICD